MWHGRHFESSFGMNRCHTVSMEGRWDITEPIPAPPKPKPATAISLSNLSSMVREVVKGIIQEQVGDLRGSPQPSKIPFQGKKAKRQRSPSPHAYGDQPECESEESFMPPRPPKGFSAFSPQPKGEDSLLTFRIREEGELLGEEDQDCSLPQKVDRLCPSDYYHRVLDKSTAALDLELSSSAPFGLCCHNPPL